MATYANDPWANYHAPNEQGYANFNFTQDPYYNSGADKAFAGYSTADSAGGETDRQRVWRWTLDSLGGDPGSKPQAQVQTAYLNAIRRLRQDYLGNGAQYKGRQAQGQGTWATSPYAQYDQFLGSNDYLGMPQYGLSPATPGNTDKPSLTGNAPGDTTVPQTMPVTKMPDASRPTIPTPPANAPVPTPSNGLPTPTPAPQTGGTPGVNRGLSADAAAALDADPEQAYNYMLRQLGFDPNAPSRFGDFLKQRFQPLLAARLAGSSLEGGGGTSGSTYLGSIGDIINSFGQGLTQQGGDFFGQQRDFANQALQSPDVMSALGGISEQSKVEQYLNQLATLKYAGANPMIQQSVADTLQRGQGYYNDAAFDQLNSGKSLGDPYLTWLRNNPLYNKYLGVK